MSLAAKPQRSRSAKVKSKPKSESRGSSRKSAAKGSKIDIDIVAILRRRLPLLIVSGLIGGLLAAAYLFSATPLYESRAKILLMTSDAANMASRVETSNELVSQDLLATHMSLIQSPKIVAAALQPKMPEKKKTPQTAENTETPENTETTDGTAKTETTDDTYEEEVPSPGLEELPSLVEAAKTGSVTEYVIKNLYVTRGGKASAKNSHTLNIAFHHTDPEDARKVVVAIVEQYQIFVDTKFKDINEVASRLITDARTDLEKEIEQLTKAYQTFRMESPLISSEGVGGNIHEQRFQVFAAQIAEVSMLIDETVSRLELCKTGLDHLTKTGRPAIEKLTLIDEKNAVRLGVLVTVERGEAHSATFMALQPERAVGAQTEYSTLLQLKGKLKQAERDYGANHPEVRDLKLQIDEMEGFMNKRQDILTVDDMRQQLTPDDIMSAYLSLLESDLVALKRRKVDLEKQMAESEEESKKMISIELENQELLTKLSRAEALYDSVVTRLRDINMQQDTTSLIHEEIESPKIGEKVSRLSVAALIAISSCFVLSFASVLIAELSDKRLHSVEQIEEVYQAPVLGLIPDFNSDSRIRKLMRGLPKGSGEVAPSVISYHAGADPVSETIRTIRTQLVFELGDDKRVLAITSPNQGDGKTTVTSNLAVSLAAAGKSVLVVDCDMRRPSLHKQFGLDLANGLSGLLNKTIELGDAIRPTKAENLSVITAGGISKKPAELLSSAYFCEVLEALKNKFDLVILDCPPIIPVTDPAILAPLTDGVILVTFLDSQSEPKSRHCMRVLTGAGANLIGVVVNKGQLKSDQYYQTYSGYYNAYESAESE